MKKGKRLLTVIVLAALAAGIILVIERPEKNKSTIKEVPGRISTSSLHPNRTPADMYRLYNPNSGEHFYTKSRPERDQLKSVGWRYEGVCWEYPETGDPVYRLYNPNTGDHHYTISSKERKFLIRSGWRDEGIGWYSGGSRPVYRQYNPNATTGSHNFTASKKENDALVRSGWKAEGIAWYALS